MTAKELEQAYLSVYDEQAEAIFRHCYFRVYDRDLARDLMQESFTKAWQYVAEGKEVKHMRALVYRIANNLIVDYVRKKREESLEVLTDHGFEPKSTELDADVSVDAVLLLQKLQLLDAEYREAVYMRYIDNLTPKEIAAITGESVNTISVRIHRGVKRLRVLAKAKERL